MTSRWSEPCSVLVENKSPSRPPSPGKAHRRILAPLPTSISIADFGLHHVSPQLHRSCILIPSAAASEIGIHCRCRGLGRNRPSPPSPGATAEYRAEEGKGAAMMVHSLSLPLERRLLKHGRNELTSRASGMRFPRKWLEGDPALCSNSGICKKSHE